MACGLDGYLVLSIRFERGKDARPGSKTSVLGIPSEVIAHAVWLYIRFNLSLREVEELLLRRGIDVSYETIRRWMIKFGPVLARGLRRRQARPGDVWHLDELRVEIAGRVYWLWRSVDQSGVVLDEILQSKRDNWAAKRLLRSLIKRHGLPR